MADVSFGRSPSSLSALDSMRVRNLICMKLNLNETGRFVLKERWMNCDNPCTRKRSVRKDQTINELDSHESGCQDSSNVNLIYCQSCDHDARYSEDSRRTDDRQESKQ